MKPQLTIGADVCMCGKCGLHFNSTKAFDKHRTGPATDRRCRTVAEMTERGMSVNAKGRWITAARFVGDAIGTDPVGMAGGAT